MARFISRLLVVCLIVAQCLAVQAPANSVARDDATLLDRLQQIPAPVRDLTEAAEAQRRQSARLDRGNVPPTDDAPVDEIADFWSRQRGWYPGLRPSEVVRERLLGAIGDAGRNVDALV